MPDRKPSFEWTSADVGAEGGVIDRIVPFKHLRVPRPVRLDGEQLIWGGTGEAAAARIVPTGKRLLTDFVNLADAMPEQIRDYAERWGVLNICEHDLPVTHNPPRISSEDRTKGCVPRRCEDGFWESIAVWREFARKARAVLIIASFLKEGDSPPAEAWSVLQEPGWDVLKERLPSEISQQRLFLTFAVNRWLVLANLQLLFSWHDNPPDAKPLIHVAYPGLFSVLSLQLLAAVVGGPGFLFCSECPNGFFPTRRPDPNERHYCPTCRAAGVPARNAKQAQQRRKKDERTKGPTRKR